MKPFRVNSQWSVVRSIAALLLCVFALSGCKAPSLAPGGVYAQDKLLYQSENLTLNGYETIHEFVTWEFQNRAALSQWPEIKQAADVCRKNAKQWFEALNQAHDVYAASPTPGNGAKLQAAMELIKGALQSAVVFRSEAMAVKLKR